MPDLFTIHKVDAGDLRVTYREYGHDNTRYAVLLHGFPYDVNCFSQVAPQLVQHGYRVIVPFLRGFGSTRFLSADTMRSGQQAALGHDLIALLDALAIKRCVLGGFDWGGRAACIVSALWPDRVDGLVTCGGYNIQNIARANEPADPEHERQYWYQYYFHSERGRAGLAKNRDAMCQLLWSLWSPNWSFDADCFSESSPALHNPDFVDVVIHSYRHRYGLVAGDPQHDAIELQLAESPVISVPTIVLDGAGNGVSPAQDPAHLNRQFSQLVDRRIIPKVGHNIPQEAPDQFTQAICALSSD